MWPRTRDLDYHHHHHHHHGLDHDEDDDADFDDQGYSQDDDDGTKAELEADVAVRERAVTLATVLAHHHAVLSEMASAACANPLAGALRFRPLAPRTAPALFLHPRMATTPLTVTGAAPIHFACAVACWPVYAALVQPSRAAAAPAITAPLPDTPAVISLHDPLTPRFLDTHLPVSLVPPGGATWRHRDQHGWNAAHWAVMADCIEWRAHQDLTSAFLPRYVHRLAHAAPECMPELVREHDQLGLTPLELAVLLDCAPAARLLLTMYTDRTRIRTNNGKAPLLPFVSSPAVLRTLFAPLPPPPRGANDPARALQVYLKGIVRDSLLWFAVCLDIASDPVQMLDEWMALGLATPWMADPAMVARAQARLMARVARNDIQSESVLLLVACLTMQRRPSELAAALQLPMRFRATSLLGPRGDDPHPRPPPDHLLEDIPAHHPTLCFYPGCTRDPLAGLVTPAHARSHGPVFGACGLCGKRMGHRPDDLYTHMIDQHQHPAPNQTDLDRVPLLSDEPMDLCSESDEDTGPIVISDSDSDV
ncbi:hypothetical protein BC828DRAFT_270052 [Blastocladiella britannica]|nr:hypothetical protein BC828DRAFT_270052 [Blastocladiella britannica]